MSRPVSVRVRLRVDPVACDAFGFCAELLPERVTLDDWGYPIVDGKPISPELRTLAKRLVHKPAAGGVHAIEGSHS